MKRDAEEGGVSRLLTRDMGGVLAGNSAVLAAYSLMSTVFPLHVVATGGEALDVGIVMAAFSIAATAVRIVVGRALDRRGYRRILLLSVLGFALGHLVYVIDIGPMCMAVVRVLHGLSWGAANTAGVLAVIEMVPRSRRGEGLNVYAIAAGAPMAFSPWLALRIAEVTSIEVVFILAALLGCISLALFVPVKEAASVGPVAAGRNLATALLVPGVVVAVIGGTYGMLVAFIPIALRDLGSAGAGIFFLSVTLAATLARIAFRKTYDRVGLRPLIATSLPLLAIGLVMLSTVDSIMLVALAAFAYGVGFGLSKTTVQIWCVNASGTRSYGVANAVFYAGFDIGLAAGALASSALVTCCGFRSMFLTFSAAPALAIVVLIAGWGLSRYTRVAT